jgi:putative NADPH-quinone reductase
MDKKNILIVYAHHEPKSMNSALLNTAIEAFREGGHAVKVSDLYRMSFNHITCDLTGFGASSQKINSQKIFANMAFK